MKMLFAIAMGGALGAVARHGVNIAAYRLIGPGFPAGTLAVNVAGSFAMGVLIGLFAMHWSVSQEARAFLTVGFLGAFTTFSTFSMDVAVLVERKASALAALYLGGSVLLSIAALFIGLALVRAAL